MKLKTYVIVVPREVTMIERNSKTGSYQEEIKMKKHYFCLIKMGHGEEPLIMYTKKLSDAIFYTQKELDYVQEYMLSRGITEYEVMDSDRSVHRQRRRKTKSDTEITKVNISDEFLKPLI